MKRGLPTRAAYDAAAPFEQGYLAYTYSAWPGSEIPSEARCPYETGSNDHADFQRGVDAAARDAQDSEE